MNANGLPVTPYSGSWQYGWRVVCTRFLISESMYNSKEATARFWLILRKQVVDKIILL